MAKFNHFISDENLHQVWQLNLSPTVEVLDTGRPVIIPDALMDRKYIDYWTDAQVQRFRTVVLLPLGVCDELGRPMILSVHAAERLDITEDDLRFLSTLADLAGIAVDKGLRLSIQRAMNNRLEQILQLQRNLMIQALGDSTLDSILHVGQQFLKTAFIIVDLTEARILCGGFETFEGLNETTLAGFLGNQGWQKIVQLFRDCDPGRFNRIRKLTVPADGEDRTLSLIVEPVIIANQRIGGIALVADGELDELSTYTAESIWMVLSVILLKNHIRIEKEFSIYSRYIAEILEGRLDADDKLPIAEEKLLLFDKAYRILAVLPGSGKTPNSASRWAIARAANAITTDVILGVMGAFIVLMIPETDRTSDAFAEITPRIVDDLRRINGRRPVIAQSAPCSKLLDYASAWRKMVRVLRWGLENGSEGLLGVPDAGAFGLLADIVDHRVTRDYVRNVLGPVRAYDKKHTTQFFPTLQSLVRNGGRPQPAAAETGVHITTIRYRIDRLKELFGLNLRDSDVRFQLDLALRLDELLPAELGLAPPQYEFLESYQSWRCFFRSNNERRRGAIADINAKRRLCFVRHHDH